jgi:hypothetical protein
LTFSSPNDIIKSTHAIDAKGGRLPIGIPGRLQIGMHGRLRRYPHDKTRPSRIPPLASGITERVVTLARTAPPTEATHWTSAMMAKVVGISASFVRETE